jgi:hypothetical protein
LTWCLPTSHANTADLLPPPPMLRHRKKCHGPSMGDTTQLCGPIGAVVLTRPSSTVPGLRPGRQEPLRLSPCFESHGEGQRGYVAGNAGDLSVVSCSSKENYKFRSFRTPPIYYKYVSCLEGSRVSPRKVPWGSKSFLKFIEHISGEGAAPPQTSPACPGGHPPHRHPAFLHGESKTFHHGKSKTFIRGF